MKIVSTLSFRTRFRFTISKIFIITIDYLGGILLSYRNEGHPGAGKEAFDSCHANAYYSLVITTVSYRMG